MSAAAPSLPTSGLTAVSVTPLSEDGSPDEVSLATLMEFYLACGVSGSYLSLNRHELRVGIAVRKEIFRRRGAITSATCRYPIGPLSDVDHDELTRLLDRAGRGAGFTPVHPSSAGIR